MAEVRTQKHDPRALDQMLFETAKKWWYSSFALRTLAAVVGIVSVLFSLQPKVAPFVAAAFAVAAELALWRAESIRRPAEVLLRKLDALDSFGWPISNAEMSDMLARTSTALRSRIVRDEPDQGYFASQAPWGAKRAVENTQESAWWSKHLSARTMTICLILTCLLLGASLVTLVISIETIRNFDVLSNIGRAVTSVVVLVMTLGLIRLTVGYHDFSERSREVENYAERLLRSKEVDEAQAIKVMHEYQLARAGSPMLPTFVWRMMQSSLDQLWRDYRCSSGGSQDRAA